MRNLKKFLALVLATLMVVGAMVATTVSAAEADYSAAVETLNRIDVYRGYGAGAMGDTDLVTRWHMALFIARITTGFTNDSEWKKATNETPFTDVTADHYLGSIAAAYKAGIIEGVGNNQFAPAANIKYQDALTMVVRALGWDNLDYPLGYIQKAQVLGLTDGLEELDNKLETAITRGQTAQILANALWVECKDGTNLLRDVLKVEMFDGKVVATNKQHIDETPFAAKDCVTLKNADGETLTIKAELLVESGKTAEDLLGHTYKIASNTNWKTLVTSFKLSTEKTLQNFGTQKTEFDVVPYGTKPNMMDRLSMIKVDGKIYGFGVRNDNGKTYYYEGDKHIDLYVFGASTVAGTETAVLTHYYNAAGDIVDADGNVILKLIAGEYYKGTETVFIKATAADIEAAKRPLIVDGRPVVDVTADAYKAYTKLDDPRDVGFSEFGELRVIDDNGDGLWDTGYFTPYVFAKYEIEKSSSNVTAMDFYEGKTVSTKQVIKVNGNYLTGFNGNTLVGKVAVDGVKVKGTEPANGDYIVYKYNPYTGDFVIVQNLGKPVEGLATKISGTGSYVTIDGVDYKYNLNQVDSYGYKGDSTSKPSANRFDGTADEIIELEGFDTVSLTPAYQAIYNKTYKVSYLAVGGYLVYLANPAKVYDFTSYVAFEFKYDSKDLVKIDADGNLVVKAIVDATGVKKEIKISDVENYKLGLRLADELKEMGFGVNDKYTIGSAAQNYKANDIIAAYVRAMGEGMADLLPAYFYAARVNADGTYSLVAHNSDDAKLTAVPNKNAATITFSYGINNTQLVTENSDLGTKGKFATTAATRYVFVGNNGVDVFEGVADNGATINLAGADTKLYSANASCIFVVNTTVAVETLYSGFTTGSGTNVVDSDYSFLAIVKGTKAELLDADTVGNALLIVTGLYDVITGETVDARVFSVDATSKAVLESIYEAVNAKEYGKVIVSSEADEKFYIDEDYSEFKDFLDDYWTTAVVTGNLGKLNDKYTLTGAPTATVASYKLTTIWGYEGVVEVVDGSKVADFSQTNTVGKVAKDYSFWTVDAKGNVTGYVFALNMSQTKGR